MKIKISKKRITLDDLAVKMASGFKRANVNHESLARMVAKGFEDTASKFEDTASKKDLEDLATKDGLENVKKELKQEIQGLRNSVNNYLRLTNRRYLELENKQKIIAKYLKIVIQKIKIPVDLKELELVIK